MRSTLVSCALRMSLKHLPISFLDTVLTATISLKVLGTPSCLHAMYMHAAAIASLVRPLIFLPSWTVLKSLLALSVMVLCRFIRSAMILRNGMSCSPLICLVRLFLDLVSKIHSSQLYLTPSYSYS